MLSFSFEIVRFVRFVVFENDWVVVASFSSPRERFRSREYTSVAVSENLLVVVESFDESFVRVKIRQRLHQQRLSEGRVQCLECWTHLLQSRETTFRRLRSPPRLPRILLPSLHLSPFPLPLHSYFRQPLHQLSKRFLNSQHSHTRKSLGSRRSSLETRPDRSALGSGVESCLPIGSSNVCSRSKRSSVSL